MTVKSVYDIQIKFAIMSKLLVNKIQNFIPKRGVFDYLVILFNRVNEDRLKQFGPDRTCAEWLLRNGAALKWLDSGDYLRDYNCLPLEGHTHYIQEVDATDSSISHHGFDHFRGCNHISKLVLNGCCYICDDSLELLDGVINKTLKHLEISGCECVSDKGLEALKKLTDLRTLIIHDLPNVKDCKGVVQRLKTVLPNTEIKST